MQTSVDIKAVPPVAMAWRRMGLPAPAVEFRFHVGRDWRFDYAWPAQMIALEVQGGIWSVRGGRRCPVCRQAPVGRHLRGASLKLEWEKLNTAAIMGWRILYCEPREVTAPGFVRFLKAALTCRP